MEQLKEGVSESADDKSSSEDEESVDPSEHSTAPRITEGLGTNM